MKRRIALLVLVSLSFAHAVHAEIVTLPFESTITGVYRTPFGIQAVSFQTPVTGSFSYDTPAPPTSLTDYGAGFQTNIPNGFVMNVAGVTLSSSSYTISTLNDYADDYVGDLFIVQSSGDLLANGAPAQGYLEFHYRTSEELFSSKDDAHMLPTSSELAHVNMVVWQGFIRQSGVGSLEFRTVPEPCAILLVAQSLCVLGRRRRICANAALSEWLRRKPK
jgi:hypothetical protein